MSAGEVRARDQTTVCSYSMLTSTDLDGSSFLNVKRPTYVQLAGGAPDPYILVSKAKIST